MPKSRKKDKKELLPVIHIFCEGEKTEPIYIHGYVDRFHSDVRRLKVIDVKKTRKNTPVQLVNEATNLRKSADTPGHDVIWVVYDRESPAKYDDALHQRALDKAKANGIEVALSNVCFEIWLLLHVTDNLTAPFNSYDDLIKNSKLKQSLRELGINDYKKADTQIFEVICGKIETAIKRAEKMNEATLASSPHGEDKPHLLNPYTRVGELLKAIDDIAQKSQKKPS